MNVDVAIVGGGVSGLASAWELRQRGFSTVVLERQVRTGGHAISQRIGGFVMEHGPSTVNAMDDHAQSVSTRLGLDGEQTYLGDGVKRRYLVGGGVLRGVPIHPLGFLMSNYLSLGARARILCEPFIKAHDTADEETVHGFATRRFGTEFASRVMDPLVGGLYAGRAEDLSMASVFPQMQALEKTYGSVVKGLLMRRFQGGTMPAKRLYSWRGGLGTLPSALRAVCGDVMTGVGVRSIRRTPQGYGLDCGSDGTVCARAVVVATQPHVAAGLIEDVDPEGAAAAATISTPPLAVVFLGYRREQVAHPLDGLGFLATQGENTGLSGAQFSSTMYPGRAPDGCVSLTAYIGGARQPDLARLAANDLIALARRTFGDLLGARGAPMVARVRHWNLGLPQYRLGHRAIVQTLAASSERSPGLFLTGNYLSGPSVATCLTRAHDTAAAVAEMLDGGVQRPENPVIEHVFA